MFHLRVKVIGRARPGAKSAAGAIAYRAGSRCGASAMAYRAGMKLRDPKTGRVYDYSKKASIDAEGFGILYTETMLPRGAPDWMADRQKLIDAVEAKEKRADAQLLREVEVSLPRELTFEQQRELLREFVQANFVAHGMVADVAMHDERASDGGRNPHAHILLTMRSLGPDGFGNKVRAWNSKELVRQWREAWADKANEYLARFGHERRLDHRSHADRAIELMPDSFIGPSKGRDFDGPIHAARRQSRAAAKRENVRHIDADPTKLLNAITREKATFTRQDVLAAIRRTTDLEPGDGACARLIERVLSSPELVTISHDDRGPARYATRDQIKSELDLARAARALAARSSFDMHAPPRGGLSVEQQAAFLHATQGADLVAISGVAGAGKTTTLAAIAAAYQEAGFRVRGIAQAGIAAKNLTTEAGIASRTIASAFYDWDRRDPHGRSEARAPLERGDVLIVDEAGMIGTRDMRRLLAEAERVRAKVILVGDSRQLQAIDAGAPFRAIVDTYGAARLEDVRRQRKDWQQSASKLLAAHQAGPALDLYRRAGAIRPSHSTAQAMDEIAASYLANNHRDGRQIILAHRVADVRALNERVRSGLRAAGMLGEDIDIVVTEQKQGVDGEPVERLAKAQFARGDRILFTKNDRRLDVQNGLTGRVDELTADGQFLVRLDDGKQIAFNAADYNHIAPGYALTIHKAQGATFDRSFVLASNWMDANLAYVALTRHKESVELHYGRDQFENAADLDRVFARQRPKDNTLDYLDAHCRALSRDEDRVRSGSAARGQTEARSPAPAPVMAPAAGRAPRQPLTAADRVRQSAERIRQAQRDLQRERGYGD